MILLAAFPRKSTPASRAMATSCWYRPLSQNVLPSSVLPLSPLDGFLKRVWLVKDLLAEKLRWNKHLHNLPQTSIPTKIEQTYIPPPPPIKVELSDDPPKAKVAPAAVDGGGAAFCRCGKSCKWQKQLRVAWCLISTKGPGPFWHWIVFAVSFSLLIIT